MLKNCNHEYKIAQIIEENYQLYAIFKDNKKMVIPDSISLVSPNLWTCFLIDNNGKIISDIGCRYDSKFKLMTYLNLRHNNLPKSKIYKIHNSMPYNSIMDWKLTNGYPRFKNYNKLLKERYLKIEKIKLLIKLSSN